MFMFIIVVYYVLCYVLCVIIKPSDLNNTMKIYPYVKGVWEQVRRVMTGYGCMSQDLQLVILWFFDEVHSDARMLLGSYLR